MTKYNVRQFGSVVCMGIIACALCFRAARAQEEGSIALISLQTRLALLSDQYGESDQVEFVVDAPVGSRLVFEVRALSGNLQTWIRTPSGATVDAASVIALGGEYFTFEGEASSPSIAGLPIQPGWHYYYVFPSQGPGTYEVHFSQDLGLAEDLAVVVNLLDDSPVGVAVFTPDPTPLVGHAMAVTAAVFEGAAPVPGASVNAYILAPDQSESLMILLDNQNAADAAASDGLYSGMFTPPQSGEYVVVAEITGQTASGVPFVRAVSTSFVVAGGGRDRDRTGAHRRAGAAQARGSRPIHGRVD